MSKFDQQDIFAGEQVELTSGQTATVFEVLASNRLKIVFHSLLQVVPETYYSVAFDDGTFCDNHDPEEVKYELGTELVINTEVKSTWHLSAQYQLMLLACWWSSGDDC